MPTTFSQSGPFFIETITDGSGAVVEQLIVDSLDNTQELINFNPATGKIQSETDTQPNGTSVTTTYNASGAMASQTVNQPNGSSVTTDYNASGQVASQTQTTPGGDTVITTYSNGSPVSQETIGKDGTITQTPLCFMEGTRILTPRGEIAVEDLRRGDLVTTTSGRSIPIRWVGIQTVHRAVADFLSGYPVCIQPGALGDGMPSRHLLVSPAHALAIDGILAEARALVNGKTITRATGVPEKFRYFHIELESHELVLANGVPAETYIDNVAATVFDNASERDALPASPPLEEMKLPRAKAVRQVPLSIRRRLEARSGRPEERTAPQAA